MNTLAPISQYLLSRITREQSRPGRQGVKMYRLLALAKTLHVTWKIDGTTEPNSWLIALFLFSVMIGVSGD